MLLPPTSSTSCMQVLLIDSTRSSILMMAYSSFYKRKLMSVAELLCTFLLGMLRHTHMFLPKWACSRFASMTRPSPHETIKAKLPSTLLFGF